MSYAKSKRYPTAEAVFFGLRTMVTRDRLDGNQRGSAASHLVRDVYYDLLGVQVSGSLANHVSTAVITLKDRAPLLPAESLAYYQRFKDIRPSLAHSTFPLSRSYYADVIQQHQLVMIRFFGNVLEAPLSSVEGTGGMAEQMDFVGVVDVVLEDYEQTNEGTTKVVRVMCKNLIKVLVDDQIVYYPQQGYTLDEHGGTLMDMVQGSDSEVMKKRGLILNNRILGRLYDQIDVSKVSLQDMDENMAAQLSAELQRAEFGLPMKELLKIIFARFPSLMTTVNYSRDGVSTFPVTLRPRWKNTAVRASDANAATVPTIPNEDDPTEFHASESSIPEDGLRTDLYGDKVVASGLLELQVDDVFAFENPLVFTSASTVVYGSTRDESGTQRVFGDQTAPSGHIEIKDYVRIYSQLLTGQGSVLGFIEGLVNRPWIELFGETYGRHNNLVFRSPPFDFEDMLETYRQQVQLHDIYSRVLPADQPNMSLQKGTADVYNLFSMDIDDFFPGGSSISFYVCPYVCLIELVDRFGVRPLPVKCQLMPKDMLFPGNESLRETLKRKYDNVRRNAQQNKVESNPADKEGLAAQYVDDWLDNLRVLRDRVVRWYAANALFRSGTITVRCPRKPIRSGTWITVEHTKDIFYVEGWEKNWRFGASPTATIHVSRGFNRVLYPLIMRRTNTHTTGNQDTTEAPAVFSQIPVVSGVEFTLGEWRNEVYPNIVSILRNNEYNTGSVVRDFFSEDVFQ